MVDEKKYQDIYLSIVIPAYNEEKRLSATLSKIFSYLDLQDFKTEVIVVDDGSTDKTNQIVVDFQKKISNLILLRNENNCQKGFSVQRGVLNANGKYILYSDADLSTPIYEMEKFYKWFKDGYDIVIGSRRLPESEIKTHQYIHRRIAGFIYRKINSWILGHHLRDTQCGFKCFKRETAIDIFKRQTIFDFAFDVEILCLAINRGYKIKEVAVQWNNFGYSRLNFFKDSFKMLNSLIKIKRNLILKKY